MADTKPLSLLETRKKPGYQFYACLRYDRQPPEKCLKYAILVILQWLRERIGGEELPKEITLPEPQRFPSVPDDKFVSWHFGGGYSVDITSLLPRGIWAATVREPDVERMGQKAIVGRTFVTEIGLHCLADEVELGVRIDILDPVGATGKPAVAYRPMFLRKFFENKQLRIYQEELLLYDRQHVVNNMLAMKRLTDLIRNGQNSMPIIVLTHAVEKKNVSEVAGRIDRELGLTGESSFMACLRQADLLPATLEFSLPVLPYDAAYMALHTFGYARVYEISADDFYTFRRQIDRPDLKEGEMLWMEPACFGGAVRVVPYDEADDAGAREEKRNGLINDAHRYSENKTVGYGGVVFELSARRMEAEEKIRVRLAELRSGDERKYAEREENAFREAEELVALYEQEKDDLAREVERLRSENQRLSGVNGGLEEKCRRMEDRMPKQGDILIAPSDENEFFRDEQRDLILSSLAIACERDWPDGSRAKELLRGILDKNSVTGEGRAMLEELKHILFRNNNITGSDAAEIRELGFEVSHFSNNHYRLVFRGDERYTFTLPSTSSDNRSMKNCFSDISGRLGVYK